MPALHSAKQERHLTQSVESHELYRLMGQLLLHASHSKHPSGFSSKDIRLNLFEAEIKDPMGQMYLHQGLWIKVEDMRSIITEAVIVMTISTRCTIMKDQRPPTDLSPININTASDKM